MKKESEDIAYVFQGVGKTTLLLSVRFRRIFIATKQKNSQHRF